ncbi:hypothetical protein KIPB_014602, partial [Kipferlia bialata]|eukprot:g14602.t1
MDSVPHTTFTTRQFSYDTPMSHTAS